MDLSSGKLGQQVLQLLQLKGYFSMALMAVCDAKYHFAMVDVGAFGQEGDEAIFSRSKFGSETHCRPAATSKARVFAGGSNTKLICLHGDEAFPLKVNMM